MDPRLDLRGRPWRLDSEWALGMTVGAFMWMQEPPFVLDRARYAISIDHQQSRNFEQAVFVPDFEVATTNSQLEPGMKESYPLLPFRALEGICLPGAIQQRWEASIAASKSAEWRLWFKMLDLTQQKAHIQSLAKRNKDTFWAGLWLEYEEWSKPRNARCIAAATRALVIFERENVMRQMREAQKSVKVRRARMLKGYGFSAMEPEDLPEAEPLSAPLTPHDIISLRLRLAPCYFRLPASTFRFATQIFSGKSYEEAVTEQKANFHSWTNESKVRRIEGHPDFVVWGNIAVHKDAVPKLTPKKKQPQTGKHRYQDKQSRSGCGEGCQGQ